MKQPIIRLHQSVFDKLEKLAQEYRAVTGDNISYSKLIAKLIASVDKLDVNVAVIKTRDSI